MKQLFITLFLMCAAHCAAQKEKLPLQLSGAETQAIVVRDLDNDNVIFDLNGNKLLRPASLTKLITTAATLEKFEPHSRINTKAYYDSENQTLCIVGMGDPTYNSRYFKYHMVEAFAKRIAEKLKAKGVTRLLQVTADTHYEAMPLLPSSRLWEDIGNYYGAAPQALNYADNSFTLTLSSPASAGEPCKIVSAEPDFGEKIDCYVRSSDSKKDSAYIYGTEGGRWYVSGSIPKDQKAFKVRGALPEPWRFFLKEMINTLRSNGIEVMSEGKKGTLLAESELICSDKSPNIISICEQTNKHSINLFADALFLRLAFGEIEKNDWDASANTLQRFCKKHSPNSQARFYDGSGLSPFNLLSANTIVDVLAKMGDDYRGTLAVAGRDGTLRSFGKGTALEGKIWGKSGSMTGVLGYAGYAKTKDGRNLVFCILVNNHTETNTEVRKEIVRWLTQNIAF